MTTLPIIQSLWIGATLSKMERLCIISFLENGHDFHLYTYEPVNGVPSKTIIKDANEILPRSMIFSYQQGVEKGSWAGFSNYFRYKLLHMKGGYWVDTDTICLKPYDFKEDFVFCTQLDESGREELNNSVIKAPPGSLLLLDLFEACISKDVASLRFGECGPVLMRDAVKRHNLGHFAKPYSAFSPLHYYELNKIVGTNSNIDDYMSALFAHSYSVHLWNEMWRRSSIDKNGQFPSGSVYQFLLNRYDVS
jgi:hypothetical protein